MAKIIGIRLGAPVEGWTYQEIKEIYGDKEGYLVDYKRFAADDDSNGPLFFLRALEDCGKIVGNRCIGAEKGEQTVSTLDNDRNMDGAAVDMTAEDVAEALLNYAPFEHGFFWWGGYGVSTEHTAYLNLRSGIPAPQSGSIRQNGKMTAEQIGGQIFIDTWGLVAPGQPDLAAKLAARAASVAHDGDGIHGGIFIAVCISYAFMETDIKKILEKGLSYLPQDCRYAMVVGEVMDFYKAYPEDWESCYEYIYTHHGYDKYPGICHIIPNIAVMILALLYGEGDFSKTLQICNRCGWETDCNVGNVATIMGVRGGLEAIGEQWRRPVNDFLACSSVMGSLNHQDIPYGACYIAKLAWKVAGEELPEPWKTIIENRIHSAHFEFPGSTHAMEVRRDGRNDGRLPMEYELRNTDEKAYTGKRSLQVMAKPLNAGQRVCVYQRCYMRPEDFQDDRYAPAFSPIVYSGDILHGAALLPKGMGACQARLYAKNARTGEMYLGDAKILEVDRWMELSYQLPAMEGVLLDEVGFAFERLPGQAMSNILQVYVDDFYCESHPAYSIEFANENSEMWTNLHREISQFTRLKGHFYLEEGKVHLSCGDFGEVYTGRYDWKDYQAVFEVTPMAGKEHYTCVRVQGGTRAYFAGLVSNDRLVLLKNTRQGLQELAFAPFKWKCGETYQLTVNVKGNRISISCSNLSVEAIDFDNPYLQGSIGLAVRNGSHVMCGQISIKSI